MAKNDIIFNALTYLIATPSVLGNGSKMADQQVALFEDKDEEKDEEQEENAANDDDYAVPDISRPPTKFRLV